jgi:hypothetical protein
LTNDAVMRAQLRQKGAGGTSIAATFAAADVVAAHQSRPTVVVFTVITQVALTGAKSDLGVIRCIIGITTNSVYSWTA